MSLTAVIWIESITMSLTMAAIVAFTSWRLGRRRIPKKKEFKNVTPASMPLDFLQPEKRRLHEIPAGESVWIGFTDVEVDLAGKTWVNLSARVYPEQYSSTVKVSLQESSYRLTSPQTHSSFTFTPRKLSSFDSYGPVIEVVVEDGPTDPLRHRLQ